MANPLNNSSGPEKSSWNSPIANYFKPKLDKVAEFMGGVALRIPVLGSLIKDHRADRQMTANLRGGMTEDQAQTTDTTQKVAEKILPPGQPSESRQNSIETRERRTGIEHNIESLKLKIEGLKAQIDKNVNSMDENAEKEGLDQAIPGLNSKLGFENFGLQLQIEALEDEIINLQMLDPELQIKAMKDTISEMDNIDELQTILQDVQKRDWPNRDKYLDSITLVIKNRINEIKNNK
jgi:hypothetical protein